jgi:ABC-type hemin transport system ATPase subunit
MSERYDYVRISEALLERVALHVLSGECVAIFGPRNAGKRYVLRQLRERILPSATAVGVVSFLKLVPDEEDVYLREVP